MAMNIRDDRGRHDRDQAFDCATRELHAHALTQVSPHVRARLRAARVGASAAAGVSMHRFGWMLATGFAAVFALAIGVQWRSAAPAPTDMAASVADIDGADTNDAEAGNADGATATLDENPDFYLWLASNDDAVPVTRKL